MVDIKTSLKSIKEFFGAVFDYRTHGTTIIRKEGNDKNDEFMLLCFGDLLGLPLPTSYYTLELLPYLAEELEGWERRMIQRREFAEEKFAQYNFC